MLKQDVILVHKINVAGRSKSRINEILRNYQQQIINENYRYITINVKHFVIPVNTCDSSIECIYPMSFSICDKEDIEKFLKKEFNQKFFSITE